MDLVASLFVFAIYALVFGCVHIPALRVARPRRLLIFLLVTYAVSATVSLVLSVLVRGLFSSAVTWQVANLGGLVGGFFAAGLYAFLGPATADRSSAAQMLLILLAHQEGVEPARFVRTFETEAFMLKRLDEFRQAGLIAPDTERVLLTPAGTRFARLYRLLQDGLHLRRRGEYVPYFRPDASDE